MENILEVRNLNKFYKDFRLTNVDFTLQEGCITGFIGINGSGKTTTIRSILNLVKKNSGTIKIFGKDIDKCGIEIKNRIGIVLDDGCFYDGLTMNEMKSIIAPAYSNWNEKEYKNYMDYFSLNPHQRILTLSQGMRMKFALALALSHHAELLIMDEPTSGLDPLVRSQLLNILKEFMKQNGKSIFFSTHITSDLDKIADMLIFINNGRIIAQEEKDALLDTHSIIKGDCKYLNRDTEKLFLNIQKTTYGFRGLTNNLIMAQEIMNDILVEKPTIEDVMLAYIERDEINDSKSC